MPRALRRSIAIIALAAVAFGGAGCRPAEEPAASLRAETTGSVDATGTDTTGSATSTEPLEPLAPSEADALEKELDAIEKELDSLDLPNDNDFKDIEGAL